MAKDNPIIDVRQHRLDRYAAGADHAIPFYYLAALLLNGAEIQLDRDKVRAASGQHNLTEPAARRTCVGKDPDLFR